MPHETPHARAAPPLPTAWPRGIRSATAAAGIRRGPGDDLLLLAAERSVPAAAILTRNRFAAAPIERCRAHLAASRGRAQAILINAGCANAATGAAGAADALRSVDGVAALVGCRREEVLVDSTGVIGPRLPIESLLARLPDLAASLDERGVANAARAIMTTDTAPKASERRVRGADGEISIVGIAKGAGMIHPDMATMIGIVATDASIDPPGLDTLLRRCGDRTFNRISIDGDTSTNDAVFAIASGVAGAPADPAAFAAAFEAVCLDLARMIVADGEGATRVIEVEAIGAAIPQDAREVAATIGSSLLVRTAIAGGDPNWGRIVAALGRTRAAYDPQRIRISVGGLPLFAAGAPEATDRAALRQAFSAEHVQLQVDLAAGPHADRFLTCDLTEEYIRVNASMTT